MFSGRKLLIATKHQKEKVIAPLMERELGLKCFVAEHFDTDLLGTFTGEVERKEDAVTTARNKCLMAMQQYDCDLAVASEGSFGAHPSIFFIPADDEILFFIDKKNQLEITGRELSTETNFGGEEIITEKQLLEFVEKAKFPSHGLIIRKTKDDLTELAKGITDWEELKTNFHRLMSKYGTAFVETDMRAMFNPSRMKVIEKATENLITKIKSQCPLCGTPGFGVIKVKKGLPCRQCNFPTRSALSYIYTCQKCSYTKEEMYPNQLTAEDPMYCDVCNP
ncbi:MAG: DUF6671 family protein [Bacteroidia bacterium]